MDSRKVQLGTQIRATQDEQKVDQFLKVFDIIETEEIACHLPFVFGLRLTDDAMSFQHLLKAAVIISTFLTLVPCLIDCMEIIPQAGTISDEKAQRTDVITSIDVSCQTHTDGEEARLLAVAVLPTLAQFLCDRRTIGITPLEF